MIPPVSTSQRERSSNLEEKGSKLGRFHKTFDFKEQVRVQLTK